CKVINNKSRKVVMEGKRYRNIYKDCILSLSENELTCLSVLDVDEPSFGTNGWVMLP
ncbi:hypothetical protein HAX54_039178, partial [Datura stramonium]|nr:hypothetical protein [Datura stramonium]